MHESSGPQGFHEKDFRELQEALRHFREALEELAVQANGPELLLPPGARTNFLKDNKDVLARHLQTCTNHQMHVLEGLHQLPLKPAKLLWRGLSRQKSVHGL